MVYVLIVVLSATSAGHGFSVAFETQAACDLAKHELEHGDDITGSPFRRVVCAPTQPTEPASLAKIGP